MVVHMMQLIDDSRLSSISLQSKSTKSNEAEQAGESGSASSAALGLCDFLRIV